MKILDYQQAFGATDVTGEAMTEAISQWFRLYYGTQTDPDRDPCQRIAYTVVSKLVRTVFSEYTATCPEGFYRRVLTSLDKCAQRVVQLSLVGGECYIKPWPTEDGFGFTLVPRNGILIFGRDDQGLPTDVGLTQRHVRGRYTYTLLERRTVDAGGYLTLENRLYRSLNPGHLGQQVKLSDESVFAALPERYTYPTPVGSVGLVQVRTPMLNCVDGSDEGVSVYAAATGLIHLIDRNEAQLADEFDRGESRIIASRDLLDTDNGLSQHLFLGLDEDPEQVGLHIFSPQLREQSFLARKLEYLRNVESVIGLQRGMLSEVNAQQRTATEVSASGGEFSLTVMDFQRMWHRAVLQTLELCRKLAGFYGIAAGSMPQVSIDWGNGILHDEDALWQDYKDMVSKGLMAPEVALGWRFGLPAQTEADRALIRKRYMPGQNQ